jgi:hypothetical protein
MDDSHHQCGLGRLTKKNPAYQEISGDFFNTILDHCEPNEGVALYNASPWKYSVTVLGLRNAELTEPKVWAKELRPLTAAEKPKIEKLKKQAETSSKEGFCTTEPNFLNSAQKIFSAKIKGTSIELLLSTYDDPGCAGHLARYYVLDLIEGGKVLETVETSQYIGGL